MPVVVEIGIPVGEVEVRHMCSGRYEELSIDEHVFSHLCDDFWRKVAGIQEYDITPVLEVACVSVGTQDECSWMILSLKYVLPVVAKELFCWRELLWEGD